MRRSAWSCQVSKATLSRVLRRHGLHRLASLEPPKAPVLRYERDLPGELLHLDIKKLGRFAKPGVRATGDRAQRNPGAGVESLHVAIDDHARFAFVSLHPDEKIPSALDALLQAVAYYKPHGITIQRLRTDRGSTYRAKLFAATCQELGLKHRFTRPYRPQTNGKAERFIQTITREWAYARSYDSSDHRASFLPYYLHDYNFHRPHSALTPCLLAPDSPILRTTCRGATVRHQVEWGADFRNENLGHANSGWKLRFVAGRIGAMSMRCQHYRVHARPKKNRRSWRNCAGAGASEERGFGS